MANSMDAILVKYGVSLSKEEYEDITYGTLDEERRRKAEELKSKIKTLTVPEFLDVNPDTLSEAEQKIQRAIRIVYELNEKDPPLYSDFKSPDEKSITIDTTTAGRYGEYWAAQFIGRENRIVFEEMDADFLILSFAHELAHANLKFKREIYGQNNPEFVKKLQNDAYAQHQESFLDELQAYILGARAYYEIFGSAGLNLETKMYAEIAKKHTDITGHINYEKVEAELANIFLRELYNKNNVYSYKRDYETWAIIGENDVGLDSIPEYFHFPEELIFELKKIPKEAYSLDGQLLQAKKNERFDQYLKILKNGATQSKELPDIDLKYLVEHASLEEIYEALDLKNTDGQWLISDIKMQEIFSSEQNSSLLKHLLSMNRNGKKVISPKTIWYALRDARKDPESFSSFVTILQNDAAQLPITEQDYLGKGRESSSERKMFVPQNPLVHNLERKNITEILPQILKLKGKDGMPLVSEQHLFGAIVDWVKHSTPDNFGSIIQVIVQNISDKNGRLRVSRDIFEQDGKNIFLTHFPYSIDEKKIADKFLPILISLKDKDGKSIISQENIDCYPECNPFSSAIKSFAKKVTQSHNSSLTDRLIRSSNQAPSIFEKVEKTFLAPKVKAKRQVGE